VGSYIIEPQFLFGSLCGLGHVGSRMTGVVLHSRVLNSESDKKLLPSHNSDNFCFLFVQLRCYLEEEVVAPVLKTENTAIEIRHAEHVSPSMLKLALTSPINGGR
jgi:hypothetical protein